ncbi:MAG: D-3-phosphoglycerate dehydrogenase [Bacteroidetes bacterium ADurb.Bin397]|jgi:D-3-phosphoglycerate dehydrogenase|nr:MAG: D-3-phosphoglycerate dehydrogenase [Bacteroidetes bacterium ADurb.Bin397]
MKGSILFIDSVHQILQDRLESSGWKCINGTQLSRSQILETISAYSGIVIRSRIKIDAEFLDHATHLKFIARAGAGMENIDVVKANELKIVCINAPEGNRNAVAEHAMGMLLALLNKLITADQEVRNGIWKREENRGIEIEGKRVTIIGFGNTGSSFARKLAGFNCEIQAVDPYIEIDRKIFPGVRQITLTEAMSNSDIVSLHVPLTAETEHLVNLDFISKFKSPFYLINTSRGAVVSLKALVTGLQSGNVAGAALDVLELESSSFEKIESNHSADAFQSLIKLPNVVLSPHVAGWSFESHRKISEVLADKILIEKF